MVTFNSDVLSKLCSADQLDLLNSIDHLRLQGINKYVSLPQIVVCGDQSSGKSSVLEAISGVSFPVKSNLCTRFPTELVLRRASHVSASVGIVPHESRSESEQKGLKAFHERLEGFDGLPQIIESAKVAMGITTHGKTFSKDILRVEITGPDHPHLTIVDLPGLIHSETKNQTASDVELISDVVNSYMKEPRCIILAVISAKNDFANQIVLKLARAADSTGDRTLGVITKPDTLIPGSPSEALYVSLARNQEVEFRLGWHVLKNMDSDTGVWSLADRDASETSFFGKGSWKELPLASLGIGKLRTRLSRVLLGHIASELPSLITEIDNKFMSCHEQLARLGEPRATIDAQKLYLFQLSQRFQTLVKASVDGTYNDPFFEDAKTENGYRQRIRAVLQNRNDEFASDISRGGHFRKVLAAGEQKPVLQVGIGPHRVTQDEFIEHIEHLIRRTKGRELPGTFNPMIIHDLFREQSQPWEFIVKVHVRKAINDTGNFLQLVIAHMSDELTSKALQREVFDPAMRQIRKNLEDKTVEVLNPHKAGHPITYNHYFTETLQNIRRDRRRESASKALKEFFELDSMDPGERHRVSGTYDLQSLVSSLAQSNEPDLEKFAAREAMDCLDAYYKVAMKRFIDDVAVEVIEDKLISKLHEILSPVSVWTMSDDEVTRIAGESEESRTQREQLTKQLDVLKKGLETCRRFVGMKIGRDAVFAAAKPEELTEGLPDVPLKWTAFSDSTSGFGSIETGAASTNELLTPVAEPESPLKFAVEVADSPVDDDIWGSATTVKKKKKMNMRKSMLDDV